LIAAEFPKTPSPKPARIPPQTPPAGGTEAEAGRIHIPRQMFRPAESALVFRVLRKMGSDFFKQTPQLSFSPYFAILCAHGKRRQNGEKTASNPRQRMGGFEQPAHLDLFHPFSHLTRLLLPLKPKCAE